MQGREKKWKMVLKPRRPSKLISFNKFDLLNEFYFFREKLIWFFPRIYDRTDEKRMLGRKPKMTFHRLARDNAIYIWNDWVS